MTEFYTALVRQKNKYTPGRDVKIFVGELFEPGAPVPTVDLQLVDGITNTIAVGDTEIVLASPSTIDLYEHDRLGFKVDPADDQEQPLVYIVAADTPSGATNIPIRPAEVANTGNEIARKKAWIPVYSFNTASREGSSNIISANNFSDGLDPEKVTTSNNDTGSGSGNWYFGDPGLTQLFTARKQGQLVFAEFRFPLDRGGFQGILTISGDNLNMGREEFIQTGVNFEFSGGIEDYVSLVNP